ncbi:MAG: GNAT family N-acetyltransferase [Cypionkella sp.]|nr:GNAT family N-acetyltransferase [Cypionkella sp.]
MEIGVTEDIATCRALRRRVFIEEQGVSEADEIDDKDGEAIHLLARVEGRPVGSARLLILGETGKIGRVCVLAQARGTGLGAALMRAAVAELRKRPGVRRAKLGAQTHALGFYERLGFVAVGPVFDDAGIPHREMVLEFQGAARAV